MPSRSNRSRGTRAAGGTAESAGFTLVEALVVTALLGIALVPILSTARRLLVASQREERGAALAEIAESRLSVAGARLDAALPADTAPSAAQARKDGALPSGWRDSGTLDGAFWTIHARPLETAGGFQRWRIDSTARDPDGAEASTFREYIVTPRAQ